MHPHTAALRYVLLLFHFMDEMGENIDVQRGRGDLPEVTKLRNWQSWDLKPCWLASKSVS